MARILIEKGQGGAALSDSQALMANGEVLTDCTLCYHSCGTRVTIENGRAVRVAGLESHPLNKGALCPKGKEALEFIYSPERLTDPLKKKNGQ